MKRLVTLALLLAAPIVFAQQNAKKLPQNAVAPKAGFRTEFLADLDDVQKKIIDLATAVPAEKYTWRPNTDVRSVSEVYMHIAGGNYFAAAAIGRRSPNGEVGTLEQIEEKDRVLEELRKSFEQLREAILAASDADLDKNVKMYGTDTTARAAMLTALNHIHEHLGQSIAYARMNGIVPPWSAM